MITYVRISTGLFNVKLDGKMVGTIRSLESGNWKYFPKGNTTGGEEFESLAAVKASLEAQ